MENKGGGMKPDTEPEITPEQEGEEPTQIEIFGTTIDVYDRPLVVPSLAKVKLWLFIIPLVAMFFVIIFSPFYGTGSSDGEMGYRTEPDYPGELGMGCNCLGIFTFIWALVLPPYLVGIGYKSKYAYFLSWAPFGIGLVLTAINSGSEGLPNLNDIGCLLGLYLLVMYPLSLFYLSKRLLNLGQSKDQAVIKEGLEKRLTKKYMQFWLGWWLLILYVSFAAIYYIEGHYCVPGIALLLGYHVWMIKAFEIFKGKFGFSVIRSLLISGGFIILLVIWAIMIQWFGMYSTIEDLSTGAMKYVPNIIALLVGLGFWVMPILVFLYANMRFSLILELTRKSDVTDKVQEK